MNHPESQTLVFFCIDSYDSESRLILQHFSRSTRLAHFCTALSPKFEESDFGAVQKCVNLVERQKSIQMRLLSLS